MLRGLRFFSGLLRHTRSNDILYFLETEYIEFYLFIFVFFRTNKVLKQRQLCDTYFITHHRAQKTQL